MRKFPFALAILFFLFTKVAAQQPDTRQKALMIFNEKPYYKDISSINPNDIQDVYVLKAKDAFRIYGAAGKNGAILIVTKQFMLEAFQRKLGIVSEAYKEYIALHPDDKNVIYIINCDTLKQNLMGIATVLYKIPTRRLKNVDFKSINAERGSRKQITVSITTD